MNDDITHLFPVIHGELGRQILSAAERRTAKAGTVLYEEGFPCPMVPFVLKGTIRVYKLGETGREITLYRVEAGQLCILSSTCAVSSHSTPIPAVAVVESDVEMLAVPTHIFRKLLNEHFELQQFINQTLADRLAEMMMVVDEVAFGRVDLRLADRLAKAVQHTTDPTITTTHQDLAVELGSAREVVSRILKDFERKGMVRLGRGKIEVLAPEALGHLAENRAN